jgi:ferritin-like metal-binding protein YciE
MKIENLNDLYVEQLRDIYSAETQLTEALPKMVEKSSNPRLRKAFERHLEETRGHRKSIEQLFEKLDESPDGETCKAMKGLVKEAEDLIKEISDDATRDAGMIASAQRVEHYEIAAYGTVRSYAEKLGREDDVKILDRILDNEKETDKLLTDIAVEIVNPKATEA